MSQTMLRGLLGVDYLPLVPPVVTFHDDNTGADQNPVTVASDSTPWVNLRGTVKRVGGALKGGTDAGDGSSVAVMDVGFSVGTVRIVLAHDWTFRVGGVMRAVDASNFLWWEYRSSEYMVRSMVAGVSSYLREYSSAGHGLAAPTFGGVIAVSVDENGHWALALDDVEVPDFAFTDPNNRFSSATKFGVLLGAGSLDAIGDVQVSSSVISHSGGTAGGGGGGSGGGTGVARGTNTAPIGAGFRAVNAMSPHRTTGGTVRPIVPIDMTMPGFYPTYAPASGAPWDQAKVAGAVDKVMYGSKSTQNAAGDIHLEYTILASVVLGTPPVGYPATGSKYYDHMAAWYAARGWNVEGALLHQVGFTDSAHRVTGSIWGSARAFINCDDPHIAAYQGDRLDELFTTDKPCDEDFIDEQGAEIGAPQRDTSGNSIASNEYASVGAYYAAYMIYFKAVRALRGRIMKVNPANYTSNTSTMYVERSSGLSKPFFRDLMVAAGDAHAELENHYLAYDFGNQCNAYDAVVDLGGRIQIVNTIGAVDIQPFGATGGANATNLPPGRYTGTYAVEDRLRFQQFVQYMMWHRTAANVGNQLTWFDPNNDQQLKTDFAHTYPQGIIYRAWDYDFGLEQETRQIDPTVLTTPSGGHARKWTRRFGNAYMVSAVRYGGAAVGNEQVTLSFNPNGFYRMLMPDGTIAAPFPNMGGVVTLPFNIGESLVLV